MTTTKYEAKKRGFKYCITISQPLWKGYKFSLAIEKAYGDSNSHYTEAKTVQDALKLISNMIKQWQGYDGILDRAGDKVTDTTLFFKSFTPEITKAMILSPGQQQLFSR